VLVLVRFQSQNARKERCFFGQRRTRIHLHYNIECLFRGGVVQKEVKISLFLSRWQKHPIPFIDHRESPFTFRRRNTKRDPFRATSKSGAKPTGLSFSFSARAIGDAARDRGRSDVGNGLCTIIIIIIGANVIGSQKNLMNRDASSTLFARLP